MKKGNKKETMKPMTVQDVTTEIFEHCKETEVYQHPTTGKIISSSQLKLLCPASAPYFKNSGRLLTVGTIKLSEEEAQAIGVKIFGNPKLGIRMFTEEGCETIGKRLPEDKQKRYFMIVKCLFHKDEVRNALYQEKQVESEKQIIQVKQETAATDEILNQFGKLLLYQTETVKAQTEELKRIADSLVSIKEMMEETKKGKTTFSKKDAICPPKEAGKEPEKPVVTLKVKRGDREPVYRTDPRKIQNFREEVLEGIPSAMHSSVLHSAYKRMRDVYGVPVDTYKNEYFAETGKPAKSSLEIVHWLEFRNPAIRGLLRSCVQNAMESSFSNAKEESDEQKA